MRESLIRSLRRWGRRYLCAGYGGLDTLAGTTIRSRNGIRMVPDILQYSKDFCFPVFTAEEEMGEYGQHFSRIEQRFLETIDLARNNERNVAGIVVNAFSDPLLVSRDLFDLIQNMPSALERKEDA